jgi:GAF domain-containing protein
MPIDPAELATSIGSLYQLDLERGLAPTLQQVVDAAKVLVEADGTGLMLADREGRLRWASASNQFAQNAEDHQEQDAQGPCVAAFIQRTAMSVADAREGPDAYGMRSVLAKSEILAAVSVPVELEGGPIGTLDVYSAKPREWDNSEISALQAYAAIVASLLGAAVAAQAKGRLAEQLQAALEHRSLIERAKGILMAKHDVDAATAFERLRSAARSSRRPLIEIVRDVIAGKSLSARGNGRR